MEQYKINLLKLAAKYDIKDTLLWSEELDFSIMCSDAFFYATADAEDVHSQEDVDLLEQCIKDCLNAKDGLGELHGTLLYVAKKRKMRPLPDIYTHIPKAVQELLNACGPDRENRNLFSELKEGIDELEKRRTVFMWNKDIVINDSKIEGKGLFVTKDIKKDELLIDYSSLDFYKLNVNELTEYQINHNWIIMIDNIICETTDTKKELDYINHSRNPNCNWFIKEKYITAARDIKAGEELTIDYRLEKRSNRTKFPEWI